MAEKWAVITNKGGVLKTSITTNLAGLLCQKGRVLIVDTDEQGNCSDSFGFDPSEVECSIYHVLVLGKPIEKAIVNVHPNIDLVVANESMSMFEVNVLSNLKEFPRPLHLLKDALKPVIDQYDFILFDSPPSGGIVQGNVLNATEKVVIPFQPENNSLRSTLKIIKSIKTFKEEQNHSLSILGVVATLVDTRTNLHKQIIETCKAFCEKQGITFFKTLIPKSIHFASSVAYEALPATITTPKHIMVRKYINLLGEMQNERT